MAESVRLLPTVAAIASMVWLAGCATVPATAAKNAALVAEAERNAHARVQYEHREGCVDRTTGVMPVDAIYAKANAWADARGEGDYSHPQVDYQAPSVRYPKSELAPGTAEAVLVIIFINPDGTVGSSEPVCSTRRVFDRYAQETVNGNRYVPARFGTRNVRGVAFQTILFSTYR